MTKIIEDCYLYHFFIKFSLISLLSISYLSAFAQVVLAETFEATNESQSNSAPDLSKSSIRQDEREDSISITLPEIIELALEGNRDLRNQTLQRIIDEQELREAEQEFDIRLTPIFSAGVTQSLSAQQITSSSLINPNGASGNTASLGNETVSTQTAALSATLLTPLGTDASVLIDPLEDTQPLSFQITQPLLRGFGTDVNRASIEQARLTNNQGQLALQEQTIDTITSAIVSYTALIQNQEAVRIQEMALERRRQQLEILQALVEAGRRAPVDLFDTERSIADAERDLIIAQNLRDQANTDLLNLIGTDIPLQFFASPEAVQQLFQAAIQRISEFDLEGLIETTYQLQPEYLQAQHELNIQKLNLLVAENDLRWQLDIQANGNLGDFSEGTIGLIATRTFPEPSLETNRVQSEVGIQQVENQLAQLQESIRNDVTSQFGDVYSNLARVEAARSATENAERQLEVDKVRFSRGIGGVTIFQIITQEQNLVEAQNAQLQAEIAFLNSIAELEQTSGITLERWEDLIIFDDFLK